MVICDDDQKGKTFNKVTKAVITRHVENLRNLDAEGKIELCGPFKGRSEERRVGKECAA